MAKKANTMAGAAAPFEIINLLSDEDDSGIIFLDKVTVESRTQKQIANKKVQSPVKNAKNERQKEPPDSQKPQSSKRTRRSSFSEPEKKKQKIEVVTLPDSTQKGTKRVKMNEKPEAKVVVKRKLNFKPNEQTARKKAKTTEPTSTFEEGRRYRDEDDDVIFVEEIVAAQVGTDVQLCKNVMKLLDEDNTIPFIARYRKGVTNNMEISKLREVHEVYENYKITQTRANVVLKKIESLGGLTPAVKKAVKTAVTLEEVEFVYAPFKVAKKSHAKKARELGLEPLAQLILDDKCTGPLNVQSYLVANGSRITLKQLEEGVQHILADVISKDPKVLECVRNACKKSPAIITSTKAAKKPQNAGEAKKPQNAGAAKKKGKSKPGNDTKGIQEDKFQNYFDNRFNTANIQPYQVMALNRGENMKILKVKVTISPQVRDSYNHFCCVHLKKHHLSQLTELDNDFRLRMFTAGIDDAYNRLVDPLLCRQIRSDLTKNAEKVSLGVFAKNIRQVLLTPPLRGKVIMAIDPGFRNGCKVAIIAANGDVLSTTVIYPHSIDKNDIFKSENCLKDLLVKFRCETIGIGNGTACRETETFVSKLIKYGSFAPLDVKYCIVDEHGVSIYSVSDQAIAEMPDLEPNLRSAVALARRMLDPLSEYVKVDPKHIGVGMYQHDVSEPKLKQTLEGVITECVSFVGVDINTCNEITLSKVSGLTAFKAKKIIEWRTQNGCVMNREQLKMVASIGEKTFVQCAGFVRVLPDTISSNANKPKITKTVKAATKKKTLQTVLDVLNPLDQTCVHPESYSDALRIIRSIKCNVNDIGQPQFIAAVKNFSRNCDPEATAKEFEIGVETLDLILEGLSQEINFDIRDEFDKPTFRKGITSMEDLKPGTCLTGKAMNVVDFGIFVDIGVGTDGLLHRSGIPRNICKMEDIKRGDVVEVQVKSLDVARQRIGLTLVSTRK